MSSAYKPVPKHNPDEEGEGEGEEEEEEEEEDPQERQRRVLEQLVEVDASKLPKFVCDKSGATLAYAKDWFHKTGADFDLCEAEYKALDEADQKAFVFVDSLNVLSVVYRDASQARAKNVGELAKLGNVLGETLFSNALNSEAYNNSSAEGLEQLQQMLREEEHNEERLEDSVVDAIVSRITPLRDDKKPMIVMVVGDEGVGKSSFLWVWKNRVAIGVDSEVPPVMQVVLTRDERTVLPGLAMMCVDTEGVPADRYQIKEDKLKRSMYARCHAVVLLVDWNDSESLTRVPTYWIKEFEHYNLSNTVPLFVLGNKCDVALATPQQVVEEKVGKILEVISDRFLSPFWAKSSSKFEGMVTSAMHRIQCSVMFPASLIVRSLDKGTPQQPPQQPKPKGKGKKGKKDKAAKMSEAMAAMQSLKQMGVRLSLLKALAHIFQRADTDGDGILNEEELLVLQRQCYDRVSTLAEVRENLQNSYGKNLVTKRGLSFPSFLMMMMMGINQGRTDLVWKLLLGYGYSYNTREW